MQKHSLLVCTDNRMSLPNTNGTRAAIESPCPVMIVEYYNLVKKIIVAHLLIYVLQFSFASYINH